MTIRPTDKLVTYVSRDLEPYRGFHAMMRTLPDLMRARKDLKVVMVGGDGISYGAAPRQGGTWREAMLAEVGKDIDMDRVVFPGRVPYSTYLAALRRSDAHVYLTYPFVASWSLREALAIGCPVIGGDTETVREFITHGDNGLLAPSLDPHALARTILGLLEDKPLTRKLRANARAYAERRLAMADYLGSYCDLIGRLTGENPAPIRRTGAAPVSAAAETAGATGTGAHPGSNRRGAWSRRAPEPGHAPAPERIALGRIIASTHPGQDAPCAGPCYHRAPWVLYRRFPNRCRLPSSFTGTRATGANGS